MQEAKKYTIEAPVSIIIPAFNEEASIAEVIGEVRSLLKAAKITHEVIIVDDGSKDNTAAIAQESGAHVIQHYRNRGYGASLKTGIRAARYDQIVITDADGTYPVNRIPELLDKLKNADMVVGARVSQNVNIPLVRKPAKWMLRKLASYITGEKIYDLNSGLRAFRKGCLTQYLGILPDKFSFTTTITVAMLSDNYRVVYLPIDYYKRAGKSKIVPWNFFEFIALVLRLSMFFNPLKVFVPVALGCFAIGIGKVIIDILFAIINAGELSISLLTQPTISTTAIIFILSGLQILLIGMMSDGLARKIGQRMPAEYVSHAIEDKQELSAEEVL